MLHFKEFLIKLQTLDIKISEKKKGKDEREQVTRSYDISHQSPFVSADYKNEISEIKELAITDLLNLSREQIHFQLERLKNIKEKFNEFWKRYYHPSQKVGSEHNIDRAYSLKLNDLFICRRLYFVDQAEATDFFLDDLESTITYRQEVVKEFEETILRIINPDKEHSRRPSGISTPPNKGKSWPVFKEGIAEEFFNLVKEYFAVEKNEKIKNLITSNVSPSEAFIFNGPGNQLADASKQLFDANLIVGCSKAELESWIQENFQYRDKGKIKSYVTHRQTRSRNFKFKNV